VAALIVAGLNTFLVDYLTFTAVALIDLGLMFHIDYLTFTAVALIDMGLCFT
jgi:hypothetical protein